MYSEAPNSIFKGILYLTHQPTYGRCYPGFFSENFSRFLNFVTRCGGGLSQFVKFNTPGQKLELFVFTNLEKKQVENTQETKPAREKKIWRIW